MERYEFRRRLAITCPANNSSKARSQDVAVRTEGIRKTVGVSQAGTEIVLLASKKLLEAKSKGGKLKLDVCCNADEEYADNSDLNWHVVEKSDWIDIVVEESDHASLKNSINKKKQGYMGKISGAGAKGDDPDLKMFKVHVLVSGIPAGSSEMSTGRKGDLMLGSGYRLLKIVIRQQGK